MRTAAEIRAEIAEKRKTADELVRQSNEEDNIEIIKGIGARLDIIRAEINALIDELAAAENDNRGSFNPTAALDIRGASFHMGGYSAPEGAGVLTRGKQLSDTVKDGRNLDLGKLVRGIVTGDWKNAAEERAVMTTSALGAVIPAYLSAKIIDRARNVSLFTNAGVPVYPMAGNNLSLARVTEDPAFAFKAEGAEGVNVDVGMDSVELHAKTCYGYAYVSLETIRSAVNLTDILYRAFSGAIAEAIDDGFLYGGNNAPTGILNDTDINVINAQNNRYDDFITAMGAVRKANGDPSAIAINAATEEILNLQTDDNGQYQPAPLSLQGANWIVSNSLREDDNNGSDALVFDPNALAIGIQENIVVRMIQDSDECIKKGLVGFQIYAMMDSAVLYPKHVSRITGIVEPSP